MGIIRWNKEFAMEQAADDADLLEELVDIFKTSFGSDLQLIKDGVASNNAAQVAAAAHSIKGASSSLGINGVAELVKTIEEDSKQGGISVARESIGTLEEMLAEVNTL